MSVYVRWYSSILQGEVVENQDKGILSGMVAVRIQVQGMKATALFTPEHVYTSAEEIKGNSPKISSNSLKVSEKPREISRNDANLSIGATNLMRFMEENWDHQRNHLRIDTLDQFYQLWRDNMALRLGTMPQPSMKMEAPLTPDEATVTLPQHKPQPIVSDKRMAELKTELKKSLKPIEAKQLSLFD